MTDKRYHAKSASDKTDDWPFWFVADSQKGGLNVTNSLLKKYGMHPDSPHAMFMDAGGSVELAERANNDT